MDRQRKQESRYNTHLSPNLQVKMSMTKIIKNAQLYFLIEKKNKKLLNLKCNPNAYGLLRIMFMRRLTAVPQLNIVGVQLSVEI